MAQRVVDLPPALPAEREAALPSIALPRAPTASTILARMLLAAFLLAGVYALDRAAFLLMDYWLLESLGFESVFWTNFWTGAVLFGAGFVLFAAVVALPALALPLSPVARRRMLQLGVLVGLVAGYLLARQFETYLLFLNGVDFGRADPVFGHDIGFYVFELPAIETTVHAAFLAALALLLASAACGLLVRRRRPRPGGMSRPTWLLGAAATPLAVVGFFLVAAFGAVEVWLTRYGLLLKDNYNPDADNWDAGIHNGAQYLDVAGLFSTKNLIWVEAAALLLFAFGASYKLGVLGRAVRTRGAVDRKRAFRPRSLALVLLPGLVASLVFMGAVEIRGQTRVTPNEPVIQLPYIKWHVDATLQAWGMDRVEIAPFSPKQPGDPVPDVDRLLASPTIRNASLWPGYVSMFERQVDPEYVDRIVAARGDTTIYGPTLDIFRAQEKLRPYYDFMDVDTVRYDVGGEPQLFASAVRELPLVEPKPWLAWWGQSLVLFTHGYGLVAAPVSQATSVGEPVYASRGIPGRATVPALALENERVYYGEGSGSMAYSNLSGIQEHDYPTEQGRAQFSFPADVDAGVRIDSPLKRLVFGWKSGQFFDIVFSDLIHGDSRVHFFRTPLERIERLAPFLYLDTDPYAVAADGRIVWMVNAMTTTDRYPYSKVSDLGDKADRRTPTPRPIRRVNYAADSVKATVDAYTGQIRLYPISDEPIVQSWERIYPDLFEPRGSMPTSVREQMQFPVQLMHAIFDDLYIYYHQKDPLTFFSMEDVFDDSDEVKGALLEEGRGIAFSIEPYYWVAEAGGDLPAAAEPAQFSLSMAFTPEGARNLRAIATAYMDAPDYGRLSMLEVPKGRFYWGPEQADAAIDQDAFISQQIALWNRLGLEVIRGHTTPLVVDGEVIYVEPLFIKSVQNPVPQLKRVIVVFRGEAILGETLEDALRAALDPGPEFPVRPGPELGGEPGFLPLPTGGFRERPREGGFEPAAPHAATPPKTDG